MQLPTEVLRMIIFQYMIISEPTNYINIKLTSKLFRDIINDIVSLSKVGEVIRYENIKKIQNKIVIGSNTYLHGRSLMISSYNITISEMIYDFGQIIFHKYIEPYEAFTTECYQEYKDSVKHGRFLRYNWQPRFILEEGRYKYGKKDGIFLKYSINGEIIQITNYKDDMKNGVEINVMNFRIKTITNYQYDLMDEYSIINYNGVVINNFYDAGNLISVVTET